MKSSRLGCSGVRPGWIISALLVYAEEEETEISERDIERERVKEREEGGEMFMSASVNVFLKGYLSA